MEQPGKFQRGEGVVEKCVLAKRVRLQNWELSSTKVVMWETARCAQRGVGTNTQGSSENKRTVLVLTLLASVIDSQD